MKKYFTPWKTLIVIILAFYSIQFSFSQIIYLAQMPEWDENPNVIFFKDSNNKDLFTTKELPAKRALVLFTENKDGCYYPANPYFIKEHMQKYTKEIPENFIFIKSEHLSLKGVQLKEKPLIKDLSTKNAVTIMSSDLAVKKIEKLVSKLFKVQTETKALLMLEKNRADIAFIWSASKKSKLLKYKPVPDTVIYNLDLGLFCIKNKNNEKISEKFQEWLTKSK